MSINVIDSSGWIEYFLDTRQADFFEPAIIDTENLIVPAISIYEVHKCLSQLVPANIVNECISVMRKAAVIPLTTECAIAASNLAQQYQLAMADAMMYSMALEHQAQFWTQDIDYQGLPDVQFQAKA